MSTVDLFSTFFANALGALAVEVLRSVAERYGFADASGSSVLSRILRGLAFAAFMTCSLLLAGGLGGGMFGIAAGATISAATMVTGWVLFSKVKARRKRAP
ncbi:MAG: hypothetical protein O9341_24645 [Paucibacter sp.]|nr:hypothetical protein [Roseateles sp.]